MTLPAILLTLLFSLSPSLQAEEWSSADLCDTLRTQPEINKTFAGHIDYLCLKGGLTRLEQKAYSGQGTPWLEEPGGDFFVAAALKKKSTLENYLTLKKLFCTDFTAYREKTKNHGSQDIQDVTVRRLEDSGCEYYLTGVPQLGVRPNFIGYVTSDPSGDTPFVIHSDHLQQRVSGSPINDLRNLSVAYMNGNQLYVVSVYYSDLDITIGRNAARRRYLEVMREVIKGLWLGAGG